MLTLRENTRSIKCVKRIKPGRFFFFLRTKCPLFCPRVQQEFLGVARLWLCQDELKLEAQESR